MDILNLKSTDTGIYQCRVKKAPGVETEKIHLTVLDKDTGELLVKNASQEYSGTYSCVAVNRVGTDACFIVLNVTPQMQLAQLLEQLLELFWVSPHWPFSTSVAVRNVKRKKYEKEVQHDIREDVSPPKCRTSTTRSYIGNNCSSLGSVSPSNMEGYAKTPYNQVPSEDFEHPSGQNPNIPPPKVAAPNLSRMGAVPVMIPAQSKDGSIG